MFLAFSARASFLSHTFIRTQYEHNFHSMYNGTATNMCSYTNARRVSLASDITRKTYATNDTYFEAGATQPYSVYGGGREDHIA